MPLTVLAVADQISPVLYDHFRRERWQHIEAIFSCGDLSPDYLDFLGTILGVPVFYVLGNHDGAYERDRYDGFINVHGTIEEYRGLRIAGFEGCRRYNQGNPQYTEREMAGIVRRIQRRTQRQGNPDIVITHAPPADIHDQADPCHQGFDCFRAALDDWQPSYFIHGHTHAYERGEAITPVGLTTVINAYPARVIEIPEPVRIPASPRRWPVDLRVPWRRARRTVTGLHVRR